MLVNQDRFLCIALATLLNLAEEPSVQRKMVKKDITGLLLLALMTRPHLEVLLVVVGFLRRLCVFAVRTWCRLATKGQRVTVSQRTVGITRVALDEIVPGQVRYGGMNMHRSLVSPAHEVTGRKVSLHCIGSIWLPAISCWLLLICASAGEQGSAVSSPQLGPALGQSAAAGLWGAAAEWRAAAAAQPQL